jgi:serine/threonine protein phosphatase PrpC
MACHGGVSLKAFGRSDVGRVRESNEDAFVVDDLTLSQPLHAMDHPVAINVGARGILLAVSDGMGGAQAGEVASALTLCSLRRGMTTGQESSAEAALQASVEQANQRVFQAASDPGHKGMGATITAVLICGNRAYIAEVGDSRAYVLRRNRFLQVTHDQSYVQLLIDEGALTREQAETFPYKNIIAQAIGTKPSVVVALSRFTLRQKDRILLCSDGLSGKVNDADMQSIIAGAPTLDAACKALIDAANAHGGDDNITVVLAEIDGEELPESNSDGRISLEKIQEFMR